MQIWSSDQIFRSEWGGGFVWYTRLYIFAMKFWDRQEAGLLNDCGWGKKGKEMMVDITDI